MQNIAPIKTKHWLILSLDSPANVVGKGPCGIARFEDYVSKMTRLLKDYWNLKNLHKHHCYETTSTYPKMMINMLDETTNMMLLVLGFVNC